MTEYKVSLKAILIYVPLYLLEIFLIFLSVNSLFSPITMITLTSLIFAITLFFSIIQLFNIYELTDDGIKITYFNKRQREVKFKDLVSVKKNQYSFDVSYKYKGKVKPIYFGWYIKEYRQLELDFINRIQKHEQYKNVIFIN